MGVAGQLRAFTSGLFPPAGILRKYAAVTLIDSVGTGLFIAGSFVFFTRYSGLPAAHIGLGLSLAGVLALAASVPAGILGDRFGHRRMLLFLYAVRALLYLMMLAVDSYPLFLLAVGLGGLADGSEKPVRRAYLAVLVDGPERVTANAYNRVMYNVGVAVGSLGAGLILAVGSRTALQTMALFNAVSFVGAAILILRLPAARHGVVMEPSEAEATRRRWLPALRNRPFMALALLIGLLSIHTHLLNVGIPLWITEYTAAPTWSLAVFLFVNATVVILFQVRASRRSDTIDGAARVARWSGWALLLACLISTVTGMLSSLVAVGVMLVAILLLTAGELWSSAASWGLSFALSPRGREGQYLGAWVFGIQLTQAAGPLLATTAIGKGGPYGWMAFGLLFLLVSRLVPIAARRAACRSETEQAVEARYTG